MTFDVVNQFPKPAQTDSIDANGEPVTLRFIAGCKEIVKEKQIAKGWPEKRRPTETEREMLTFWGGMLTVPDGYDHLSEYLVDGPWFKGDKNKKRPPNSRVIFEEYNQELIDDDNFDFEELITTARGIVTKGTRETISALMYLNRPGSVIDPNFNLKQAKLALMEVANKNPDFIIKGFNTAKNDITVIVSKAIDYGILDIATHGKVKIKSMADENKFEELTRVVDTGGRNLKIERTCAFLQTEEGKASLAEIKQRVKKYEIDNNISDPESEVQGAVPQGQGLFNLANNGGSGSQGPDEPQE